MCAYMLSVSTVTIPYILSLTGLINGSILIILSGATTIYASSRLVKCTEITGKTSYEDFATAAFKSKSATRLVSIS